MYHETLEQIRQGVLPASLADSEAILTALAATAHYDIPVTAMLLADAKRFFPDARQWAEWAVRVSSLEGDDLHHRREIGDLLVAFKADRRMLARLFDLDQQKLLALYRLKTEDVRPFLSRFAVEKLSRDQVRAEVARWLGVAAAPAKQPLLPGFEAFLEAIATPDETAISTSLANAVKSRDQADKAVTAACRLVDSAKVFYGQAADLQSFSELLVRIQACEKQLLDDYNSLKHLDS